MAGGSKSESKPKDMTPQVFKDLQGPFADVIGRMIGYQRQPSPTMYGSGSMPLGNVSGGGATRQKPKNAVERARERQNAGSLRYSPEILNAGKSGGSSGGFGAGSGGMGVLSPYAPTGNPDDLLRGIPGYEGKLVAGLGSNEQALLDLLMEQQAGGIGVPGFGSAAQQLLGRTIAGEFLPGQSSSNPFLQAAIEAAQRPTLQGLEETLTRSLPGRFTQAGQFTQPRGSSAFDRAAAIATRGAADASADIATNMSFAGYESERGRQQDAATQLPGVTTAEINSTIANLQAQALPRMIEELGIERGLEQFQNRMNTLLAVMGIAGGTTAPVIGQTSKSKTKPNVLGPALGAL